MLGQPVPHLDPAGVVVTGQLEVHRWEATRAARLATLSRCGRGGTDAGWNFAEVWEVVAEQIPDAPAQVQGDRVVTWAEFDRRADGIAHTLLERGRRASRTRSRSTSTTAPSTSSRCSACFKAGLVPVNTNYRYADDELVYLWDNADAVAVVFHGAFAERIERIRDRVPHVRTWLWVDDGTGAVPGLGDPVRGRGRARTTDRVHRRRGAATATTSTCSTPAAPPACPRA